MSIVLKTADAHKNQLNDQEIRREFDSIQTGLNESDIVFHEGTVNFVFVKGIYLHDERKMVTPCVFVNKCGKPICELHGVLRLKFTARNALIAKTTIDFDSRFMGTIKEDEALLVHLNIPVKGLLRDETFMFGDVSGTFEEVRVTEA